MNGMGGQPPHLLNAVLPPPMNPPPSVRMDFMPMPNMMFRPNMGPPPQNRGGGQRQRGNQRGDNHRRGHGNSGGAGSKRPFGDITNEPEIVRGTLLENESSRIDIKEDGFYSGPYRLISIC